MYHCTFNTSMLLSLFIILLLSRTVSSSFIVEPKDKSIIQGETVVFKCTVTDDVVSVYWYYSIGMLDGWLSVNSNLVSTLDASRSERYSVVGNKSRNEYFLQIRNVSLEDVADYKCFYYPAKQTGPNRSPEASLTVLDLPKKPLCTLNRPATAIPSQTVTMRCTSTGTPTPQVVWLRNGNPIKGNMPRTSLNMLTWNVTEADSGADFSCVVDYPKTSRPPSCKLTPLPVKPEILVEPSVQTLVLNKTGKFVCASTGIPGPLRYKWYINGEVPSRMMEKEVHFRVKHDGKTLKILWVIKELNDAEVTCRVTGTNPDKPKDNIVHYGSARAYVSETEIIPTVSAVTLEGHTARTEQGGGEFINGESSDIINDAKAKGAKGVIDDGPSSKGTVVGVVLSMFILLALVIVLAIFLYKRNSQINKSGKRLSAQFMQRVSIKFNSNDKSAGDAVKPDTNDLYAKPMKKKGSKQYATDNKENDELTQLSQPVVLPRLVSKKKETSDDTSCVVIESTYADTSLEPEFVDVDFQETTSNDDEIIEIGNDVEGASSVDVDNKSESGISKSGSLLRSIYAKLPTARISSFMNELRPQKPSRTFAESMRKLRTNIIPKRRNKQEDKDSTEDEYSSVDVEEKATVASEEPVDEVVAEQVEVVKSEVEVVKSEVEVEKLEVKIEKSEEEEPDVAGESDDIPSSLPIATFDKPVLRRNRKGTSVDLSDGTSSKSDTSNKRSSLKLDSLLANVKRRSLSRRFSGFENRGSTPDLRLSRRIDKKDIVHFVPLGKGNDMTGNVEVVKNRYSINFDNEMSQTLLKSFHTVVPNEPLPDRIIDDDLVYENLDEKESCVSDCSAYMTDDFSDDEFDNEEGKPVERVAPMRIIDDSSVYENTEFKPLGDTNSNTDGSASAVKFGSGKRSTKQSKPTMRVKPTPTPRSFRKLNGSNSSPESTKSEHYKELPSDIRKKTTIDDIAKDIDPTTGESIYDNVDYKL